MCFSTHICPLVRSDKGCLQEAIDRGWLRKKPHAAAGPNHTKVLCTALDIAEGMKYLHSKLIVHGDLTGEPALSPHDVHVCHQPAR